MSYFIDRREDGSIALFIDRDLQFDSNDESVYHECLVAPALALAAARLRQPLAVLILGGGDGLAAREILREPMVETIDLVDLDEPIVELSRSDPALLALNGGSLNDGRVAVTIGGAWQFVSGARKQYHVIISDLTVPQTQDQTRMHSVEWYTLLAGVLATDGTVAVNAASACQTPRAYWSIVNSMRKAGVCVRPYRIALPSFADKGYGPDWGFALASSQPISREELTDLKLFQQTERAWERLFLLPKESADFRFTAPPVMSQSNDLLDSLRCRTIINDPWIADWNALVANLDGEPLPAPVTHKSLLPQTIKDLLLSNETLVFEQILDMMPALGNYQTHETLAELLSVSSNILSTIDLPALVDSLLARAAELPGKMIDELICLKDVLASFSFAEIDLTRMSARIVSIIALVVIIGNLISPDVAYAKATVAAHASSFHASSFHASTLHVSAVHGSILSASHVAALHLCGHHAFAGLHPCRNGNGFKQLGLGSRFAVNVAGNIYPARHFRVYPSQSYLGFWQTQSLPVVKPQEVIPLYVLGGYSYILPDGTVAILLDDHHSLLLSSSCNTIIDVKSGEPLIQLSPSPEQNQKVIVEIDEQLAILQEQEKKARERLDWTNSAGMATAVPQDQIEIANITMAADLLQRSRSTVVPAPSASSIVKEATAVNADAAGVKEETTVTADAIGVKKESAANGDAAGVKEETSPELQPPPGAQEMFPGVWVDEHGRYAVVHLPDRSAAYMTGKGWYSDAELSRPRTEPFPHKFQKFLLAYTKNQERAGESATAQEDEQRQAAASHLENLLSEKATYQSIEQQATSGNAEDGTAVKVHYGTMEVPVNEALTRIASDIASAEQQIVQINQQSKENWTHINMLRSLHDTLKHRG